MSKRLTPEREADIRREVASLCGCGSFERLGADLLAELDAVRAERDEATSQVESIRDNWRDDKNQLLEQLRKLDANAALLMELRAHAELASFASWLEMKVHPKSPLGDVTDRLLKLLRGSP